MKLYGNVGHQLDMLLETISGLDDDIYRLRNGERSSVGAHVRHVVVCLQILEQASEGSVIDFSHRQRNKQLEVDRALVCIEIKRLKSSLLRKENFELQVSNDGDLFDTTFHRELLAQHEHLVHHCAIIKIQLTDCCDKPLNPHLGMAKSTLEYNKTNVSA